MTTPLLSIEGVKKTYSHDLLKPKQVAVDGLSLAVHPGVCLGLMGPNGAGKTTTIRMSLGLLKPDSGKILFDGKPLDAGAKRWIGYMPEVNKLPGALTAEEILNQQLRLMRPAEIRSGKERAAAVDAKLAEVGLTAHRRKKLRQMSKGMQRRVAWAQATIHKPRFLILDEPASGLDPIGRRDMLAWIEAEKARGASMLLCTHDLAQVRQLCAEIVIVNKGRVVMSSLRGDGMWRWPWAYDIHVSGEGEDGLRRFGEERRLPSFGGFRQQGFLAVLGFADYAAAAQWIVALVQSDRPVLRFGAHAGVGDEELMAFFEGSTG